MRYRPHPFWLASLAAVLAALIWWQGPGTKTCSFFLEAELSSARPGRAQVYFDRGGGFSETDSVSQPLTSAKPAAPVRFALPAGTVRALRLDPAEHDSPVTIGALRVTDGGGRTIRGFAPDDLIPAHQIAAIQSTAQGWEVRPEAGANDPYVEVKLAAPLALTPDWSTLATQGASVLGAAFVVGWGLGWLLTRPELRVLRAGGGSPLHPSGRWALIDEVKGVAMLLVLVYHTTGMLGWDNVLHGEVGVDVFLIVTGVMLAARSATLPTRDFLRRRFFRILPAYWLALGLFFVLHRLVFGSFHSWGTLALHAVGAHGFVAEDQFFAINDSFWFISLLVAGYAVFLAVRSRLDDLSFLAGVGGGLTLVACLAYGETHHQAGLIHLAIRIPSFFAGLVLGQLASGRPWTLRLDGWLALGLGCLSYLAMFRGVFLGYLVYALAIIAFAAVLHRELRGTRWLAWWPALLGWVGALSYEIYLLHQPLMRDYSREALKHWGGIRNPTTGQHVAAIAGALVVVLGLAWLLHRALESRRGARSTTA